VDAAESANIIEILLPENKRGRGASDCREKRRAALETDTHLLKLDLLQIGMHIELVAELPPAAYYAILSRWNQRPKTPARTMPLRDKLSINPRFTI